MHILQLENLMVIPTTSTIVYKINDQSISVLFIVTCLINC